MPERKIPDNYTLAVNLFKRMSQMYGIPVRVLLPIDYHVPETDRAGDLGKYLRRYHAVDVNATREMLDKAVALGILNAGPETGQSGKALDKRVVFARGVMRSRDEFEKNLIAEELSHAAQMLLSGSRFHEWMERLVSLPQEKARKIAARLPAIKQAEAGSRLREATALKSDWAEQPSQAFETTKRAMLERHGIDFLLLLYAEPPAKTAVNSLLAWEKRMVKKGYLNQAGGLTQRGIGHIKEIRPRGTILEKVRLATLALARREKGWGPVHLRERRWAEAAQKSIGRARSRLFRSKRR